MQGELAFGEPAWASLRFCAAKLTSPNPAMCSDGYTGTASRAAWSSGGVGCAGCWATAGHAVPRHSMETSVTWTMKRVCDWSVIRRRRSL